MPEPRSALDRAQAQRGLSIRIADAGPVGQVTFKGDLGAEALARALEDWAGLTVPDVWHATFAERKAVVWMAPDELLLLCPYGEAAELVARLDGAVGSQSHMALDVSDARTVLNLQGDGVAEVLAKGAPVDLRPSAFPVGSARRTHMGGLAVVFWRRAEAEWHLACFRSFSRHLFDWLEMAARQDGTVGIF